MLKQLLQHLQSHSLLEPFQSAYRKCHSGPLLFTLYTHPFSTVICQSGLSYHFFADDSQLHKSSVPSDLPVLACCLKDCIEDVAEWIGDSKLKMNDDKTAYGHWYHVQIKSGYP